MNENYKTPTQESQSSTLDGRWILGAALILKLLWHIFIDSDTILGIYPYFKSKQFKEKTRTPRKPKWLTMDNDLPNFQRFHKGPLVVYTKYFEEKIICICGFCYQLKQNGWANVIIILEALNINTTQMDLNSDTCIVSIPKRNFKVGQEPGEFETTLIESSENYFEYQMIGDDHVQVAYYIVNGVRYVAGICIYLENPYVNRFYYNLEIIKELMDQPDYYSMNNSKDVSIEVCHRIKTNEPILITKNQNGIGNHWKLNGDKRIFESITPIHPTGYRMNPNPDCPKLMNVKFCYSMNDYVFVSRQDDIQCHAVWNKTRRRIQYSKCDTCNESQNSLPPSYNSLNL